MHNVGEAPSGPFRIGIACLDLTIEGCSQELEADSLLPGTSTTVHARFRLPQGETPVTVYAGANDDSYLWGDENVLQTVIYVPHKPAVSLALNADAEVKGYWSDGSANVELTLALLNDGFAEVEGPQAIDIACHKDGESLGKCGEATIDLADGFGPATSTVMVRAPMGSTLEVRSVMYGQGAARLGVPERILGVNRDVWECFKDRPENYDGCGGWSNKLAHKWKIWIAHHNYGLTGDPEYIEIMMELLNEYVSLLNVEIQIVESKHRFRPRCICRRAWS